MAESIQDQVEDKIIDYINFGAEGRLVITKPERNPFNADLIVEKRADYSSKKLYLKVVGFVGPAKENVLVKDFSQENFKFDKNFYLIFVYFDEILQKINENIWLISSLDFKKKFTKFQSTVTGEQKDEYSKFLINKNDLGDIILKIMISK